MIEAPRHVQLENCAAWHLARAKNALDKSDQERAERHERIAVMLFRKAQAAKQ